MPNRNSFLPAFISLCAIFCAAAPSALAQESVSDFHQILLEKATFDEVDFAALRQGETVVRLLPVNDKREVAVCGLVGLHVPAEVFLQSYLETMTQKSNAAILEIGRFGDTPALTDLRTLTFEEGDIEDLKQCVVGDCKLKLSRAMIERLRKEVDWQASDYRLQAVQLLKGMLRDYVADYVARGDAALIEYSDKATSVRLAQEQHALLAASSYLGNFLPDMRPRLKGISPDMSLVESAIVWSKIKFGLKPVIAVNHIRIFKREQGSGPQILIAAKQIYANHYFDSSLALTGFVSLPGTTPAAYLVYENRSRADGLQGPFGKLKRGIVEGKTIAGLKTILESSRANLNARAMSPSDAAQPIEGRSWRDWRIGRVRLFLWLLLITGGVAFFALRNYRWTLGPRASRSQ